MKKIRSVGMENTTGLMDASLKDIGKMESNMDKESLNH